MSTEASESSRVAERIESLAEEGIDLAGDFCMPVVFGVCGNREQLLRTLPIILHSRRKSPQASVGLSML